MNIRKMLSREQVKDATTANLGDLSFAAVRDHLDKINKLIETDEITDAHLREIAISLLAINAHVQAVAQRMNETQAALSKFFDDLQSRASRWPKYEAQIRGVVTNFKQALLKRQDKGKASEA